MIHEIEREAMVRDQIVGRGIRDPRVIDAMLAVPREFFVPEESHGLAHEDQPLPIGHGQTISQPYVVALMTELLQLPVGGDTSVLEVGAGSGYQAAILAHIAGEVRAIEIDPELAASARRRLEALGFGHAEVVAGDGSKGWPGRRFDGILVACAPDHVPAALADALKPGARMVVPVGPPDGLQTLTVVTRKDDGTLHEEPHGQVRFVPMV